MITKEINKAIIKDRTEREGMIIFLHTTRGFGFIQDDKDETIYFHITDCLDVKEMTELKTGMEVSYIQTEDREGRTKAIGVKQFKG